MKPTKQNILEFFKGHKRGSVALKNLARLMNIRPREKKELQMQLKLLVKEGSLLNIGRDRYLLRKEFRTIEGVIQTHPDGYAFLISEEPDIPDLYISRQHRRSSVHGDRVKAVIVSGKKGGKDRGRIIEIIERRQPYFIGKYTIQNGERFIIPLDDRLGSSAWIESAGGFRPDNGSLVQAKIIKYPTLNKPIQCRITKILGLPDTPKIGLDILKRGYGLPEKYPVSCIEEATKLSQKPMELYKLQRLDLRDKFIFTIDGEDARDFDDAISLENNKDGYRLGVHIADVSHFVEQDSIIDREAYSRGTSVYFPESAIHMLPEPISTDVCSLKPDEDRLSISVFINYNRDGERTNTEFHPSIIRSRYRLTYTEVSETFLNETVKHENQELQKTLKRMYKLAEKLRARRFKNGSIDFDLPEPWIEFDQAGEIVSIQRLDRNKAYFLIEEFMLEANQAVAKFLRNKKTPLLYRIHESPDPAKIKAFSLFAMRFGYSFPGKSNITSKDLNIFLRTLEDKPEEDFLSRSLLRSMKQAKYSIKNTGHFGLAMPCYTHFTSPIRRYPDLVIHRLLKMVYGWDINLRESKRKKILSLLPEIAQHCSTMERKADEIERKILLYYKITALQKKTGTIFEGVITGLNPSGIFIELKDFFVDGFLQISEIENERFIFIQKKQMFKSVRSKITLQPGDIVTVLVKSVDTLTLKIQLGFIKKTK
ncbi:MAG: ribonuclease R [Candidatus Schekmanbacteria bacterium RBG_13_48_7]|uniref:Ribonuclease R n=1 Tax=Candidatus Schekmanbacteria bacterium RBG_13_48_7 TaxID=1817878 RepID=A0A1F7RLX4_9BACT|nr:MAG: ribonuclease R [Candidatus Schekmanbacteria bacterium RBG_13_48_7]